ncbi:MAG: hypothetical protein ACRC7W_01125 [Fusobacteriaceae bacterium]
MEINKQIIKGLESGELQLGDFKYKRYVIYARNYYRGEHYIYAENLKETTDIKNHYAQMDIANKKDTWGFSSIVEDGDYLSNVKSPIYKTLEDYDKYFVNDIYYVG